MRVVWVKPSTEGRLALICFLCSLLSARAARERASLGLCLANCLPESVRYTLGPHGGAVEEESDLWGGLNRKLIVERNEWTGIESFAVV